MASNYIKKVVALGAAFAIMVSAAAGCSGKIETAPAKEEKPVQTTQAAQTTQAPQTTKAPQTAQTGPEALTLPIVDKPLTLNYFVEMDYGKIGTTTKNYADMTCYKEFEKKTGIKINFIHPPAGQAKEQFNLMLAARDLPDLIHYGWINNVPGGPQKMLDDNVIIPLNDLIEKYAPNTKKFYEKEPEIKKAVMTDNGVIYDFPLLRYNQSIKAPYGYQLRQDWLDKYGLKVPETIDEWYTVFKTLKEKDPAGGGKTIPYACMPITYWRGIRDWAGAWGIDFNFFQVDGKVKYGPIEPEYKEYLATMAKWYKEGLIDPDFVVNTDKQFDARTTGGQAASWYGGLGDTMGRYIAALKDKDPNFKVVAAPAPSLKKGEVGYNFRADSIYDGAGAAVTSKCKNVKEAIKWLDYRYSEEGHNLLNFGLEGLSYKMVNGYPQLTEEITKSPQGYSIDVALGRHAAGASGEAMILDARVREQRMWSMPVQKESSLLWNKGNSSRKLPPMTPTSEESTKLAGIINEINTYVNEMYNKFVLGQESLENYNKYVERVKAMGIDEAIKIQQSALDRFNKRK